MAKRIMNKALENKVFDEVLMVVVTQTAKKFQIQLEIGRSLGLTKLDDESSQSRIQKLHERLNGTKRILLVLDDVWENLELEEIGTPCNHKGCTILITSRNRDVFKAMNVDKVFGIEELSQDEAWILFRGRVGTCVDDTKLNSIAKDVVKKLKGLPLALTTVGAALKDELEERVWRNGLRQLENGQSDIDDVYNNLRLSYNFLRPKHKLVFLLCCLYPEDADIPIEHLTYFSMGLRIYEGGIVEEARDWMYSLTKMLKNRSLLLDSDREIDGDDYVRMHDVVRDFCKFIAKHEGHDCTWISASQRFELPTTLAFPNLRLLFLIRNRSNVEFKVDDNILEGMKDLFVLSIEWLSLTWLPHATQSLKSLNTLVLETCWGLETLSGVGELVNLEILICRDCCSIEELPPEMKELNRLKLLDLSWCIKLQRISRGIISSLIALEELKMMKSFKKWEVGENARLREMEELKMLRWLEIEIQDPIPLAAVEKMHLPSKLDRFHIKLSCSKYGHEFNDFPSNQKLELRYEEEICIGHWIETQLLPHTEALSLRGRNVNYLAKCQKLRYLKLDYCETIKQIFITPMIEHLELSNLLKLEKMWDDDRISSNSFQNLKKLHLHKLLALKHFGNGCLPQLEDLRVENCNVMEQVFLWKGETQNSHHITKTFPKLKKVKLYNLLNLTSFYQGIEGIEFPQLTELDIRSCTKMRSLASKGMRSNENNLGGRSSNASIQHLSEVSFGCLKNLVIDWNPFCNCKIDISFFNGLMRLCISGYEGRTSFITSSVAGNLCNLTELIIDYCTEMVHVIKNDERKGTSRDEGILLQLPKLEELILSSSPKLVSFCKWKCDIELPSLRKVKICGCPNMTNLTLGSLNAPNLESFDTDMNNFLHIQVPFNNTKKLIFSWCENPLNCDKIDVSHFNGLGELTIYQYKGSMSFFPSSVTGSLVNLTTLTISECRKMVKMIEDGEEKENVGRSGERRRLFPQLQRLRLEDLPELVNFCDWKFDVELPSLMVVTMWLCYNMKRFTLGYLATPKLESVCIDYKRIVDVKDLNGLLQQVE